MSLQNQPSRFEFPYPASYEVHISPSLCDRCGSSSRGPRFAVYKGFELKKMVATIYGMNPARVDFPDALNDGKQYDFAVSLPKDESDQTIERLVQEGIQKYFQLSITLETRETDVYVLTAPGGKGPAMKSSSASFASLGGMNLREEQRDGVWDSSKIASKNGRSITAISVWDMSMEKLCGGLEAAFDRPVLDETHLKGNYSFQIRGDVHTTDEFLQKLREQAGLVLSADRREVTMLVVRGKAS